MRHTLCVRHSVELLSAADHANSVPHGEPERNARAEIPQTASSDDARSRVAGCGETQDVFFSLSRCSLPNKTLGNV